MLFGSAAKIFMAEQVRGYPTKMDPAGSWSILPQPNPLAFNFSCKLAKYIFVHL
jgi:hypothetical protein